MRNLLGQIGYAIRNYKCRELFRLLQTNCQGRVLDIGGWDFFLLAKKRGIAFKRWITIENDPQKTLRETDDAKFSFVLGDGCRLPFKDGSFDTVLCVHVLEHVFHPHEMFREIVRVLRRDGRAVLLTPQTTPLHHIPNHFQNFTVYWLREAARSHDLQIVEYKALGGFWTTMASRMIYFFLQSARVPEYSSGEFKRSRLFFAFWPFMAVCAVVNILAGLVFSIADLSEEATDHLIVLQK